MSRRLLAWSLALPLSGAGVLAGHELAYRLTRTSAGREHGYLTHAPQLLLATLGLLGLAAHGRSPRISSAPFALLGVAGFALQEHLERFVHSGQAPFLFGRQPSVNHRGETKPP